MRLYSETKLNNCTICMSFLLDFYFDGAYTLVPRVKRHFSEVKCFFDEIHVLTLDNRNFTDFLAAENIVHHPLLKCRVPHLIRPFFSFLHGISELIRISRNRKDVVLFSSPYALYSVFVGRLLKLPSVVHFKYVPPSKSSSSVLQTLKLNLLNTMVYFSLKSANLVVVTTDYVKKMVINQGINPKKIVVSPNYVDPKLFSSNIDGSEVRKKLSVSKDETLFVYVGRLSREKGLDILIDAFAIVCNVNNKSKLLLVGDGSELSKLEAKCKNFGIQKRVIFLKPVPHTLVPMYLAAGDVAVLPSYSEGLPKFVIEAMMMAKPIVGTDIPGINNIARQGVEAELVKVGDSSALANALLLIMENEEIASKLGNNGRIKAMSEYSKDVVFGNAKKNPFLVAGF